MNEATRARLFEPFFTTKQPGRGTGLGLATVRRIVDEAGGAIDVHSELGSGTRIEVSFPEIAGAVIASRPNARPSGGETVLLVDDHAGARRSLHGILLSAGYRIIEASSGQQALELFSEHASQVGLLVADCTMPDMTGIELARRLEQQKRDVKVLLISGYRSHQSDPTPSSVPLIHKPFSEKEILERIRAVLDSSGELPC
jgi:CheY-like chemotaxis protein